MTGRRPRRGVRPESKKDGGIAPARRCALDVLRRVEEEDAYASVLLATGTGRLASHDRALCYEIVLGTLRRQLWLDRLLAHLAGRNIARLDAEVRRTLRAALYQLRFLTRTPDPAIVNDAVTHVRGAGFASAAGFANAVLRRATREPDYDPSNDATEELERIAILTSHPLLLVERWSRFFGSTEAEALAHADNQASPVVFRLNTAHPNAEHTLDELAAAGASLASSALVSGAWRVEGANTKLRELEAAGAIYLQSESSQLVAHLLDARAGERVLDACAAPGSKTTHLAALTGDKAKIVAGDLHLHRLRLLRRLVERQHLTSVLPVALDAAGGLPFRDDSFDRALVDAPCTGTGTLRHNPEIRWRITSDDFTRLAAIQRTILRETARVVRPGGRLVYSTCSLEPEENEEVVASFLIEHPRWQVNAEVIPEILRTPTGAARLFPYRDDTDGFFVQVLERKR